MFIDTESPFNSQLQEERHVSDYEQSTAQYIPLRRSCRNHLSSTIYKHFVPMELFAQVRNTTWLVRPTLACGESRGLPALANRVPLADASLDVCEKRASQVSGRNRMFQPVSNGLAVRGFSRLAEC